MTDPEHMTDDDYPREGYISEEHAEALAYRVMLADLWQEAGAWDQAVEDILNAPPLHDHSHTAAVRAIETLAYAAT